MLTAWDPGDGSLRWVNLGWPGAVAVVTGVNEFGTLASQHDYSSSGADLSSGRMPRSVAARHALTFPSDANLSTHLGDVFAEQIGDVIYYKSLRASNDGRAMMRRGIRTRFAQSSY